MNLAGRVKVMGVGQRVIRGGAHIGGVLTVGQSVALRETLIPVYEALELDFRPETAGGIADFDPSLTVDDVIESMCAVFGTRGIGFEETSFDDTTLGAAEALVPMHRSLRDDPTRSHHEHAADGKTLLMTDQRAGENRSTPGDEN